MTRREITAKYSTKCYECGEAIIQGELVVWHKDDDGSSVVWHTACDRGKMSRAERDGEKDAD